MSHWLDTVLTLLTANTDSLRELALMAGGDPATFYLGVDIDRIDFEGQDIEGMRFGSAHTPGGEIADRLSTEFEEIENDIVNLERGVSRQLSVQGGFVSEMIHELRTLLTTILGMTELLDQASAGDGDYVDLLKLIDMAGRRVLSHVTSLGKLSLHFPDQDGKHEPHQRSAALDSPADLPGAPKYVFARSTENIDLRLRYSNVDSNDSGLAGVDELMHERQHARTISEAQIKDSLRNQVQAVASLTGLSDRIYAAVSVYVEPLHKLLSSRKLSQKQRSYADGVFVATHQLTTLAANISMIAKLESNRLLFKPESVDPRTLFENLPKALERLLRNKLISIILNENGDVPGHVFVDREIITRVLANLLGYMTDFTPKGPIRILLNFDYGHANAYLLIRIYSRNFLINSGQHERIFEERNLRNFLYTTRDLRTVASYEVITALGGVLKAGVDREGSFVELTMPVALSAATLATRL